jgi:lipase ATG15
MQIFISILPAGSLFNPILDDVLHGMGFVESKALKEIQLNSQTTGLVEYLNNTVGSDHSISITGHSLGGGIALITGAETNIPAISISGTVSSSCRAFISKITNIYKCFR